MHKTKTANCKLIKKIETKVATELKLIKKVSSELLEVQQTNHDAVLKVGMHPFISIILNSKQTFN